VTTSTAGRPRPASRSAATCAADVDQGSVSVLLVSGRDLFAYVVELLGHQAAG
jgi:hypothetical protein